MRRPSFCLDVRFGLSKFTSQLRKGEIACGFLLARNFTDALLLGLNSLGFLGKGLTGIGLFLKAPTVKRPCNGTSGLVRGDRRKAVFAFKGLFPKGICHVFALGQWVFYRRFRKYGKTGNLRAQPDFYQQNRRAQVQDCCLVDRSRFFTALPEAFVSGMRQALEPLSATVFRIQEPQVDALCHSGVIGLLFLLILFLFYLAAIVVLPQG